MTTDNLAVVQAAGRLGAHATLLELSLASVTASRTQTDGHGPFSVDISTQPEWLMDDDVLTFRIRYEVTAQESSDEDVFRMQCEYFVSYGLPPDLVPQDEAIDAFLNVTVIFTLHPYLRELVQHFCSRFDLPPITLDVLRRPLPPLAE